MSATNNKNKNNSSGTPNKAPKTPSKKKSFTGFHCNGLSTTFLAEPYKFNLNLNSL